MKKYIKYGKYQLYQQKIFLLENREHRRWLIENINKPLNEIEFINEVLSEDNKNYHAWSYRYLTVFYHLINSIITFCIIYLRKNLLNFFFFICKLKSFQSFYLRRWLVEKFDLYDQEFKDLDFFFEEDLRNNSAWNQRFFVVQHLIKNNKWKLEDELEFCFENIKTVPENESAWNYLNG